MELLFILIIFVGGWILIYSLIRAAKKKRLMEKYGDEALVSRLMARMFWEGQTSEQLIDSLGNPLEVDRKIMKSRSREVWKYNQISRRRFGLRITLDDGIVIGWDKKGG